MPDNQPVLADVALCRRAVDDLFMALFDGAESQRARYRNVAYVMSLAKQRAKLVADETRRQRREDVDRLRIAVQEARQMLRERRS